MHISPPRPIPHWNLNDKLSNHRTIKIINHLATTSHLMMWILRPRDPISFSMPSPDVFIIPRAGLGTGDTKPLPSRVSEQGLTRQCNSRNVKYVEAHCWGNPMTGVWNFVQKTWKAKGCFLSLCLYSSCSSKCNPPLCLAN